MTGKGLKVACDLSHTFAFCVTNYSYGVAKRALYSYVEEENFPVRCQSAKLCLDIDTQCFLF